MLHMKVAFDDLAVASGPGVHTKHFKSIQFSKLASSDIFPFIIAFRFQQVNESFSRCVNKGKQYNRIVASIIVHHTVLFPDIRHSTLFLHHSNDFLSYSMLVAQPARQLWTKYPLRHKVKGPAIFPTVYVPMCVYVPAWI